MQSGTGKADTRPTGRADELHGGKNTLNTDHTLYSGVTRVSIDYKKYDEDMAKSHLFQSYTNTLLQGQTVLTAWSMF